MFAAVHMEVFSVSVSSILSCYLQTTSIGGKLQMVLEKRIP